MLLWESVRPCDGKTRADVGLLFIHLGTCTLCSTSRSKGLYPLLPILEQLECVPRLEVDRHSGASSIQIAGSDR
jgi:hypothetical protein